MRKLYLLIIVGLVVAAILYLFRPQQLSHPRADEFVDVYVDLAMLQQSGDTAQARFQLQRDSVLALHGFTDSSLIALKAELNSDPLLLAQIWDQIEIRLRDLKDEYSPLDLSAHSDTLISKSKPARFKHLRGRDSSAAVLQDSTG